MAVFELPQYCFWFPYFTCTSQKLLNTPILDAVSAISLRCGLQSFAYLSAMFEEQQPARLGGGHGGETYNLIFTQWQDASGNVSFATRVLT